MHNMSSLVIAEIQSRPLGSRVTPIQYPAVVTNDEKHNIKMLKSSQEEVRNIWEQEELFDITLEVDGHSIHAHKLVLASHSPYFRVMFCGRFQDANKKSVEIKGEY